MGGVNGGLHVHTPYLAFATRIISIGEFTVSGTACSESTCYSHQTDLVYLTSAYMHVYIP